MSTTIERKTRTSRHSDARDGLDAEAPSDTSHCDEEVAGQDSSGVRRFSQVLASFGVNRDVFRSAGTAGAEEILAGTSRSCLSCGLKRNFVAVDVFVSS